MVSEDCYGHCCCCCCLFVVAAAAAAVMMSVEQGFFSGSSHVHSLVPVGSIWSQENMLILLLEVILKFVRVSPQFLSLFLDFSENARGKILLHLCCARSLKHFPCLSDLPGWCVDSL